MMAERASILKKKGIGANGEFQNMHLAVFPYQLEYLKDVHHSCAFYFQKKYQVIGKISSQIPANKKGTRYPFKSMENIINFRLFSQHNVIYQWSAYRIHDNGEQQFNDCCTLNLKEQVSNFIVPQGSGGTRSIESLINLSFTHTELKLKFAHLGVILSTVLVVADDPKAITEFVERKYIPKEQKELGIPQINLLKLESSNKSAQSKNLFSTSSIQSNKKPSQEEKSSLQLMKYSSNQKSGQSKENIYSSNIANEEFDLDNIILTQNKIEMNVDKSLADEFQQITLQIQQSNKNEAKSPNKLNEIVEQHSVTYHSKELQVQNQYKEGILKLQSDQVIRQKQDSKLQHEELQAIEEEDRSNKQTFVPKFKSPRKSLVNPFIPKQKYEAQYQQRQQLASEPKWNLKQILLVFIILTVGALSIGIAMKEVSIRKRYKVRK